MVTKIREVIARDLGRPIEEIVKVTQRDEAVVHAEITEYVATPAIRKHYRTLLKAIAEGPSDPQEGIGIWLSGFFGSGKSAFAKNLGYILSNPTVLGDPAAELMKRQLEDSQCSNYIDSITARIPTEVVMFDVQVDRAVSGRQRSSIALYMYKALLRGLDYADDFHIAELEQSLEADGRLGEFVTLFEEEARKRFEADRGKFRVQLEKEQWRWAVRRKMSHKINEASAVLHRMDPGTYPAPDSWAQSLRGEIEITPGYLVQKTFELTARRQQGKAIAYIVDEVGAYVAQSIERIEDLRAVVEQLGKESRNRVRRHEAVAPAWVLVTSQEKLDEIVEALDTKRVELARLRDRFRYEVDLAPTDIREVATARVLAKTEEGDRVLGELFDRYEGEINERLRLEKSSRPAEVRREDFLRFYPYPPHFIDLSIDIMSGIRLQPGAARHLGGSNRTIIKQAFEMLTSERTHLAEETPGRLVTLDLVYELVENNLASERTRDISEIIRQYGAESWEARVSKVLTLLEFVRDLPRTEANVAAMLYDKLGAPSAVVPVREALEQLVAAEFVRRTPEGYKLQSAAEKGWSQKRNETAPRPRDRNEILREGLREAFAEAKVRQFRYRNLKTFKVGLTVDDVALDDGDLRARLVSVEDPGRLKDRVGEVRGQSREEGFRDELFWIFALKVEVDRLVTEVFRSQKMITEYDQLRAQGKIQADEIQLLESEKQERSRHRRMLREKLEQALAGGTGVFRGETREGSSLGRSLTEVFRTALEWVIPDLYPKLELGSVNVSGKEVEQLLTAANLKGLPDIFHATEGGLGLIRQEEDRWVPNVEAPTAREIFRFIKERSDYGESVTGKDLELRFTGLGYGWSLELIKLATAVLLRGNVIEVVHQGRRHRDPGDPLVRKPLTDTREFRKASFTPRQAVGIQMLTRAADALEDLTGEAAEIEESAIAHDLKHLIRDRRGEILELEAVVRAENLPWLERLQGIREWFDGILGESSDDCVRSLAEGHERFRDELQTARRISEALEAGGLETIRSVRRVNEALWPSIREGAGEELLEKAEKLPGLLRSDDLHEHLAEVRETAEGIRTAYEEVYRKTHAERYEIYSGAIDSIRESWEWKLWCPASLKAEEVKDRCGVLLDELESIRCEEALPDRLVDGRCPRCRAGLEVMRSQIPAVEALTLKVRQKLRDLTTPADVEQEVVRLREMWSTPIASEEEMDELLERLRERLLKALDQGRRIIVE